jgi:hypothetical protein
MTIRQKVNFVLICPFKVYDLKILHRIINDAMSLNKRVKKDLVLE